MAVEEILVHVGGPSSTKDDQRFRAMAAAYGEFEMASKYTLTGENTLSQGYAQAGTSSPLGLTALESERHGLDGNISVEVQSTGNVSISVPVASSRPSDSLRSAAYVADTQLAVAALESQLLTSSLVVSPTGSSPLAQQPLNKHQDSLDGTTESDSFHTPQSAGTAGAVANPAESKNGSMESSGAAHPAPSSQETRSDSSGRQDPCAPVSQSKTESKPAPTDSAPSCDISSLPEFIIPPSPPPSLLHAPTTHITAPLQQLAESINLSARFKPLSTSRELIPSERGYWRIDSSVWSKDLQAEFWSYLLELIGSGAAGWGVSSYRESTIPNDSGDTSGAGASRVGNEQNSQEGSPQPLGVVRIYCWGEIVGHVYLLAFVASKSKIKQTKAQWIDAEGEVVVQMP